MSTTLDTNTMIAKLGRRVPLGQSPAINMEMLNEAFRWINQQGPFVWNQLTASLAIPSTGEVDLPVDYDPGRPAWLFSSDVNAYRNEIPFAPWEEFVKQEHLGPAGAVGLYSCWTATAKASVTTPPVWQFKLKMLPKSAFPTAPATHGFYFVYHNIKPTVLVAGSDRYYPTPDAFDSMIVDLAETELLRIWRVSGWERQQQRIQAQIMNLADNYRSTKESAKGVMEAQRQMQERQALKAD